MNKRNVVSTILFLLPLVGGAEGGFCFAQRIPRTSMMMEAGSADATPVVFRDGTDIHDSALLPEAPVQWGLDVAWDSEDNVVRGTNFIGKDVLSVGRVSFQPSDLIGSDGNLSASQKSALQSRLNHIALSGVRDVILNCDHEALNSDNYYGKPEEWYKVIRASVLYIRSKGFSVITISPFNEPDYTYWGEGTKDDFRTIAKLISEDPDLKGIRISAGNTLNCDQADAWYSYMKPYVSEGNTHQLAGDFDHYAAFWQKVRQDGNHATADELHNVMEAIVGIHYGMQTGIWWGYDAAARGEFCKATYYGKEIGYGENREAWTAAAVYKRPNGRMDAFLGVSERQALTSRFDLVAADREFYFDGYGPLHTYQMEMPGDPTYASANQKNAERMIQLHRGEDVPVEPIKAGAYVIMNVNSKMCIGYYNGAKGGSIQLVQGTYTGCKSNTHQQWLVRPVGSSIGGDFGYCWLKSQRDTTQYMDLLDWSTAAGGTLLGYAGSGGNNEQWFFEYADHGDWYIRSRHSGLYLEVYGAKTTKNMRLQQAAYTGAAHQRWRFIPVDAALELTAPAAPIGLTAVRQSASVRLQWTANSESDMAGYMVLRGTKVSADSVQWDVIGRMIEGTDFLDNGIAPDCEYLYRVRAVDASRNQSAPSEAVEVSAYGWDDTKELLAHYTFDDSLQDATDNVFDAVVSGSYTANAYVKKQGKSSLFLNEQYLRLPPAVARHRSLTIAAWVKNMASDVSWTRVFDFGNGTDQYMFLTTNSGKDMRFVIRNGSDEQVLSTPKLVGGWYHLAVTIGTDSVRIYVNGELKAATADITIRPSDICPVLNYVGRSQFKDDPMFKGLVDDFRIYNYALPAEDILRLKNGEEVSGIESIEETGIASDNAVTHDLLGRQLSQPSLPGFYIVKGRKYFMN